MRQFSAWIFAGAIVFALDASWGDVALSSATLAGQTTGAALLDEPFVNPFGTKMPKVISPFGKREIPAQLRPAAVSSGTRSTPPTEEFHEGVDYRAFPGSAVRAARSGKVIFAGFSKMYASRIDKTQQSRFVIIRHADGKSSRYVHLSALHVRPGQEVLSGQILGVLAESDEWTEPVLHFEIRDVQGQPIDPMKLLVPVTKP